MRDDLESALAAISDIRAQMARGLEFRGFGPATVAATGGLAALAAVIQGRWLPDPAATPGWYLTLWLVTAALAAGLVGIETQTRSRRLHSGLAQELLWSAVEQFVPATAAGALLTVVLFRFAPEALWMVPGLWQLVFSLGIFASLRYLPRAVFAGGVWYLATGLACLAFAQGPNAFSPWAMGLPYALGQVLIAAILQRAAGGNDGAD